MKFQIAQPNFTVSLIITTYNREDALELTLQSVLSQTEFPDEVIVADDGSGEATRKMLEKYQTKMSIPLWHCWHEDKGFRAAAIRNKAIAMAKGEYVIMIDGDMILHPYFIQDHKKIARKNAFIQGKRVLLGENLSFQVIKNQKLHFHFFHPAVKNKLNMLRMPWLTKWVKGSTHPLKGVRSCNMAVWRADIISINGFNEEFVGWGREDSELVVRMMNMGIRRINVKFATIAYHLYHQEHSKASLAKNDKLLETAMQEKRVWCEKGIKQYL